VVIGVLKSISSFLDGGSAGRELRGHHGCSRDKDPVFVVGLIEVHIFAESQQFNCLLQILSVGDEAHHLDSVVIIQYLGHVAHSRFISVLLVEAAFLLIVILINRTQRQFVVTHLSCCRGGLYQLLIPFLLAFMRITHGAACVVHGGLMRLSKRGHRRRKCC